VASGVAFGPNLVSELCPTRDEAQVERISIPSVLRLLPDTHEHWSVGWRQAHQNETALGFPDFRTMAWAVVCETSTIPHTTCRTATPIPLGESSIP
jgi:hypothetical protein